MKTLLLIPSYIKADKEAVTADSHPMMDYHVLADRLQHGGEHSATILDYAAVDGERSGLVRFIRRIAGLNTALAMLGFMKRQYYNSIFTNAESVGIPLALMLKTVRNRPGHVMIGHRLSANKKRLFFRWMRVHRQMDTIFVYASTQFEHASNALRIPGSRLKLIPFQTDEQFYRPMPSIETDDHQICSAGLEWRDYPTLIDAVADMPELNVKLAAASPWSRHINETAGRTLPPNVEAHRYDYGALRHLYASSSFVVVPLYENDFQAGITTLLEAMAMGKASIVTRTTGQTDVIVNGETGLEVAAGDVNGLRAAIQHLQSDHVLRDRLGNSARQWVERRATLGQWVERITDALREAARSMP